MYNNSFWDTQAGIELAGNINAIRNHLQKDRKQFTFRFGTVEDMASFIEMMVAQGWRYIGHIDMSKKAAYDIRTGADKNPDRYLLIMERSV